MPGLVSEAAGDLFWRPALGKPVEDSLAQAIVAFEPGATPAPGVGLGLGIGWPVADMSTAVALQLAGDGRRLAIQSCSDLADRLPGFAKPGNRTPFLER